MTPDQNRERAQRFFHDVWNDHHPEAVDDFLAPGYRPERPLPGVEPSRLGTKEWVRQVLQAFPDIHFSIDEQIAERDTVVTRWTARGTHKDTFLGIPSTNEHVTVEGISIARFEDGRVVSDNVQWDTLGLMQQLGAVPNLLESEHA